MIKKAKINWLEGYKLEGFTDNNKTVMMDTGEHAAAASPAQLVLQSLAGCTMMDCVLIFTKARKHLKKFWVDVDAEEADALPRIYKKIHMTYNIESDDLTRGDVENAIYLSEQKYCRVHAMLEGKVELTSSYIINGKN